MGFIMSHVTQKREIGLLDATPEKRMFWSIVSDYDFKSALCELIDNAIDLWMISGEKTSLKINICLDSDRQLIQVADNAGGIKIENLRNLIAPGSSSNNPDEETIGIFGVGSKRAVIALAEIITIKTRCHNGRSLQIDITKDWLESSDWEIPHYEIPDIDEGNTIIDLSSLRRSFAEDDITEIISHLGEVYKFYLLKNTCKIIINGVEVTPGDFECWAYPVGFEPKKVAFSISIRDDKDVKVNIIAGLVRDRNPSCENYGVYFYCNNRLVVKELKTREVGYFITSEAGVPHPDASLCRAVVYLEGSAKSMPWNSTKTNVNYNHQIFQAIRVKLIELVSYYSSLSRRFKDDWDGNVLRFPTGKVVEVPVQDISVKKKLSLPSLPKKNKSQIEQLKARNIEHLADKPWTLGLLESVAAVSIISRQKLQTKNRIALILLDSNFEIALKEFIVHRKDLFPPAKYNDSYLKELFKNREKVISEITTKVKLAEKLLLKARHYYGLRNKLIHERATVDVADADIENYKLAVQAILGKLFKLTFEV